MLEIIKLFAGLIIQNELPHPRNLISTGLHLALKIKPTFGSPSTIYNEFWMTMQKFNLFAHQKRLNSFFHFISFILASLYLFWLNLLAYRRKNVGQSSFFDFLTHAQSFMSLIH